MTLTLWRGDHLLGAIHLRVSSAAERLEGVLLPAATAAPLPSLSQVRIQLPGVDAVMQFPYAPGIADERHTRRRAPRSQNWVVLTPVPPAEKLGVPVEVQLRICADDGATLSFDVDFRLEHRPAAGSPNPELASFPTTAFRDGSIWLVWAHTNST